MRRRSLITFVVLNVLISLGVAFAVISALSPQNGGGSQQVVITVPVLVTATPDPNATPRVVIITATPLPGQQQSAALPTGLFETPEGTEGVFATFDLTVLSDNTDLQATATALPAGCILHTVAEGDTPFGIAEQYGADGFSLMEVNQLDDFAAANLQIGQVLIVPLEGCALTAADLTPEGEAEAAALAVDEETPEVTAEPTEEATDEPTPTPTVRPTLTLPPTAENAQVIIVDVVNAGDVTAEHLVIQNTGNTVDMNGWTLSDSEENTYEFANMIVFSGASITLNTRAGANTPIVLFWGQDDAVWQPGDVATLRDENGQVQSIFRIPE